MNRLVLYELSNDIRIAIEREKQIKKWNRESEDQIDREGNPEWKDLFFDIGGTEEMLNGGTEEMLNADFILEKFYDWIPARSTRE